MTLTSASKALFLSVLALPLLAADVPAKRPVVADLDHRLAQWVPVKMTFDASKLSPKEQKLVEKLVDASREVEGMYWQQGDPDGLALWKSLEKSADPTDQKLRRMIWIQGSRYDLLQKYQPFVGTEPMPPGRTLFPKDLSREQIEAYVKAHPESRAGIYNSWTVVKRNGDKLEAIPYREVYKPFLDRAARDLREAADLSDEEPFANYLRLRAEALLSDDYFASDLAWVDLENPKFDVIIAPYETYLDDLLGVKTSWGAAVMVRNDSESSKLAVFQKYVPDIQDALPLAPEDRPSKHGRRAPMEVMDTPFRAGDLRHGYQAAADNLPNDPRVHEQKGSKRIFFKNYMDTRVERVVLPVAKLLMDPEQAARATADGYLAVVMMHEICHGLGPAFARQNGKQVDIREAIGPAFSGWEEAKADATGLFGLRWLVDHGNYPQAKLDEAYISHVAGIFRTVRFGTAEAHGRAEMMQFNVFVEKGAVLRDAKTGRYRVDLAKIPAVIADLAKTLLTMEATGDRAGVEAWLKKYDPMPADLTKSLEAAKDIPVDFDPEQPYHEWAPQ